MQSGQYIKQDPVAVVDMWRVHSGTLSASGGGRVFVLLADNDYDKMLAALRSAGLSEGLASPRMGRPTIATVDVVMMQFPFPPQVDYADRRRFVLPNGDYDDTISAMKGAGFVEAMT